MTAADHPDCPFCPANGKVQMLKSNRFAYLIQALDANDGPIPNHYFIIPWAHVESMFNLLPQWWGSMISLAKQLPGSPENFNLVLNEGEAKIPGQRKSGKRVAHLHFWVITRDHETPEYPAFEIGPTTALRKLNEG